MECGRVHRWCPGGRLASELREGGSQIVEEHAGEVMSESVAAYDSQHRQVLPVRGKRVGGYQPATFLEASRYVEDVERCLFVGGEGKHGKFIAMRK